MSPEQKAYNDCLAAFVNVWRDFDPDCTHYIPTTKLPELLSKLPLPLGLNALKNGFGDEF